MQTQTVKLKIGNMTCSGCEKRIESRLGRMDGIKDVKASYELSSATIEYASELVSIVEIKKALDHMGYTTGEDNLVSRLSEIALIAVIMAAIYLVARFTGLIYIFNSFPTAQAGMSYAALFVIGLLTSVHCIAMCGGINLSQSVSRHTPLLEEQKKTSSVMPGLKYNLGRVVSYTIIGGIAGAIGSVISFSGAARGVVLILAAVFMIIMGINTLNIIPGLKKFNPRMPKFISDRLSRHIGSKQSSHAPFYVGLLNGLMPCGPLQTMQLYALSTGSALQGAISMFIFSIGTFPLMFGLGVVSTMLSKKFKKRMITVSGVLVIALGIFMFQSGMSLSGTGFAQDSNAIDTSGTVIENGIQTVTMQVGPGSYEPIVVQKGVPVKWIINVDKENLNGCNNEIIVPEYGLDIKLQPGENVLEFTPGETGKFGYSCWMGMIRSSITVVDDLSAGITDKDTASDKEFQGAAAAPGGCCAAGFNS
ncbi:urease accessory protein UreH domain-containing protein [Proteocatella sphenisci]|uniref:urease accessory protein UreH domain-containing protein n=1 Tax=Proteocatella sphenisci TaxID=181070 RepID=UPI0004B83267|nr:sulfite exporter TauE/SafE family protein [Proteocatella sphenisci]